MTATGLAEPETSVILREARRRNHPAAGALEERNMTRNMTPNKGRTALRSAVAAGCLLAALAPIPAKAEQTSAPYAGQQDRAIKSLSPEDVSQLLAGQGWGFAKPAELNGFPGPVHLLALKSEIGLSESQTARIDALYREMKAEAQAAGRRFVEAERALDKAFAEGTVDGAALAALVGEAERRRGALRLIHLRTHLATLPVLTHHQVQMYNRLRGYGGAGQGTGHHGKHRH
ncbi:MAG: periplasmic heavy metal sensor [Rickettsiales bacterium]|jgi:Spy/CpxP family protein refolding chaperone